MPLLADRRFLVAMRVLFVVAMLAALVLALLPQPPYVPTESFGDKINHIIGFTTLSVLAVLAFPETPRWRLVERLSFFGALIEVTQSIPALGRDCEFLDWVADTVAVMVVIGVMSLVLPRSRQG